MPDTQANEAISRARKGLEAWMGAEPDAVLEVSTDQPSALAVEVLLFIDEDEGDDERTTYLVTAGLGEKKLSWSPGGAELVLCIEGDHDEPEVEALAQRLGEVAIAMLATTEEPSPGAMLEVGALPLFEGMSYLLVSRWGNGEDAGLLETDPPVRLVSVNPIYEDEAAALEGLDEAGALGWLDERGVDVDDPLRLSAVAGGSDAVGAELFGISPDAAMAALSGQGNSFELVSAMQKMVGNMESWMSQNAPDFLEQMNAMVAQGAAAPDADKLPPAPPAAEPTRSADTPVTEKPTRKKSASQPKRLEQSLKGTALVCLVRAVPEGNCSSLPG